MFKAFSAFALSATIAMTTLGASTTPARANDDVAKFIVGAIALGIIANGIRQSNATTQSTNRPTVNTNRSVRIPARCERVVQINHRHRTVYFERCLRRNDVPLRRIAACAQHGSIDGRNRTFYRKGCLRRNGHRV